LLLEISLQAESRERMLLVPRALSRIGTQREAMQNLETLWHNSILKKTPFQKQLWGSATVADYFYGDLLLFIV